MPLPPPCAAYQPRDAEWDVLYRVVEAHLDAFLDAAARQAEGARLPMFAEQEFRDFLICGVPAHGFARLRCGEYAFERLMPFSAKGATSARAAAAIISFEPLESFGEVGRLDAAPSDPRD
jgi:hypothetical protein